MRGCPRSTAWKAEGEELHAPVQVPPIGELIRASPTPAWRAPRAARIRPSPRLLGPLDSPNVILTPHVIGASDEAMQTLADQLIDNIENFVRGEPSNLAT